LAYVALGVLGDMDEQADHRRGQLFAAHRARFRKRRRIDRAQHRFTLERQLPTVSVEKVTYGNTSGMWES